MILFTIIEKFVGVLLQILSIGAAAFYTFGSMWNGPVGGTARFFCFHPNTPIKTTKGYVPIKDIKLGTSLSKENKVTSVYKFNAYNTPLYNYKNIIVSGNHLVYESKSWIRVKDSYYAKPFKSNTNVIFCLNTTQNIIKTKNNIIFKDFEEYNSIERNNKYNTFVLNQLNNTNEEIKLKKFSYTGFDKNTLVKTQKGYKSIINIKLGTLLEHGNVVTGIMKTYCNNIYNYKNTIVSGNTIVCENNKWILVENSEFAKYCDSTNILYHIQTSDNTIYTKNFDAKSIIPLNNAKLLQNIDELL